MKSSSLKNENTRIQLSSQVMYMILCFFGVQYIIHAIHTHLSFPYSFHYLIFTQIEFKS